MIFVVRVINLLFNILSLMIIASALLSFFVPPWNPVRRFLDRIITPLLDPIRRVLPPIGGFDFSPVVLLIIIYILRSLIFSLL
jgi:YggT family protein